MFADTARIVGHESDARALWPCRPPARRCRRTSRAQDTNGNGQIEASEAQAGIKTQFELYDADKNGALSGAEVTRGPLAFVRPPDLTYRDPITNPTGRQARGSPAAPDPHADDNTIVRFVDGGNVLFASDWITVRARTAVRRRRRPARRDRAVEGPCRPARLRALQSATPMLGTKADVGVPTSSTARACATRSTQGRSRRWKTLEQAQASVTMRRLQGLGVLQRSSSSAERSRHLPRAPGRQVGPAHTALPGDASCRRGILLNPRAPNPTGTGQSLAGEAARSRPDSTPRDGIEVSLRRLQARRDEAPWPACSRTKRWPSPVTSNA